MKNTNTPYVRPPEFNESSKLVMLCGYLVLFLERLKGRNRVKEIPHPSRQSPKVVATSLTGYDLLVFCRIRHYKRTYEKWWAPARHYVLYEVFSRVTSDAPESLAIACRTVLTIPSFMHWCVSTAAQEKIAVDTYLDILIRQLDPKFTGY